MPRFESLTDEGGQGKACSLLYPSNEISAVNGRINVCLKISRYIWQFRYIKRMTVTNLSPHHSLYSHITPFNQILALLVSTFFLWHVSC